MQIIRKTYSREPWRLVDSKGREVAAPAALFDHPDIGVTVVNNAVSGATKSECTDRALALLQALFDRKG